jgi:hypothetical protein
MSWSFLKSKFTNQIIFHFADVNWTVRAPDLNGLGYVFWSFVESEGHIQHPETLNDIKQLMEDVAPSLIPEMIHNADVNIRKRAELCVKEKGGHLLSY